MQIDLTGRVALVTGASKGIGAAVAGALAEAGAQVMLSSRKQEALDEAAADMQGEVATFAGPFGGRSRYFSPITVTPLELKTCAA